MKKNIRTTITRKNTNLNLDRIVTMDLSDKNNVGDLINSIKSQINHLQHLEIIEENLYFGTQLMSLGEYVPCETGIRIFFTVK